MSRADRITSTEKKIEYYSDFLTNLDKNPISGELARYTNERSVVRSIRNLINTNNGERPYDSSIGCGLKKLLFEPADDTTKNLIGSAIKTTIEQHEPRAALKSIAISYSEIDDSYDVTITIALRNAPSDYITFSTVLKRVR